MASRARQAGCRRLLYTQYNVLIRFVMKRIAKHAGGATDTSRDHEYTDWVALDQFVALVQGFSF